MDMSALQQQAWQIQIAVRARRIKVKTAYLDAQRQQIRAREQQERLRLQDAMPDAPALVIELTAWLLVARHLDAAALSECAAQNGHRQDPGTSIALVAAWGARSARVRQGPGEGGRS